MNEIENLKIKNEYLEKRCRELWNENESLKFKLFLKQYNFENKK